MIGTSAARRVSTGVRLVSIGLIVGTALVATTDGADAARRRHVRRPSTVNAAYTPPPNSAIVVDANTGRVLYEKDADGIRYPASITKVMTLYLLFEELEAGRMTLNTPLSVSSFAASQAPSKLGLRAGSMIRVEDAIKAVVTRSANDIAVAIAENIAGTEAEFSEQMTRKARALGMSQTQYRNASGLPNKGQLTSARDLATLGVNIQERFPRYYGYFSLQSFTYAGQRIGNHNRLLGKVEGLDGIKTGFVNASGFNIATSVRRDGRHIVAVVMGGRTAPSRDATARELIALYLPKASIDRSGSNLIAGAFAPAGRAKPAVVGDTMVTPADGTTKVGVRIAASTTTPTTTGSRTPEAIARAEAALAEAAIPETAVAAPARAPGASMSVRTAAKQVRVTAAERAAADPIAMPEPPLSANAPLAYAGEPVLAPSLRWIVGAKAAGSSGMTRLVEPQPVARKIKLASLDGSMSPEPPIAMPATETTASIEPVPVARAATGAEPSETQARGGWFIQIGASPTIEKAQELLDKAQRSARVLSKAEPFTEQVAKGSSTLYRARFAGLDKTTAQQACDALKRADMNCFPIKN